ncbi:MAG: winged helix-turn-helix domain-containing protein, partial [Anaerolineae bacterium]
MKGNKRRVYLLGQLRIEINQQPITLRGGKIRALFAYLILHPHRPHNREQLADILWPDAPADRVRRNLSDALYRLRQTLGDDWFDVDRDRVSLLVDEHLWV